MTTRAALIVAIVLLAAARAEAYPQLQLSTGATRCNQCHVSPAGGGLLTGYGRDAATELSLGGDGAFLHGAVTPPSWLLLGGDFRGAFLWNDDASTRPAETRFFPMQADVYAQARFGSAWSIVLAVGARGTARGQTTQALDRFGSREHYVMWRPQNQGIYARAGRFFLPGTLRLAEHPAYVRRFGGTGYEEEPYGASVGAVRDAAEWHLTVYTGDPVRCTGASCARFGGQLAGEIRLGESSALGAHARSSVFRDENDGDRHGGGLVAKHFIAGLRLLALAEADLYLRRFRRAGRSDQELITHAGLAWVAEKGFIVTASGEAYVSDLGSAGTGRTAAALGIQTFPWAHVELVVYGRVTDRGSKLLLALLHLYL